MGWKCWIEKQGGDVDDQGLGRVYKSRTEIKIGRKKKNSWEIKFDDQREKEARNL